MGLLYTERRKKTNRWIRLKSKRYGNCPVCQDIIRLDEIILYNPKTQVAKHLNCQRNAGLTTRKK